MYSLDTSSFYNPEEMRIHKLIKRRHILKNKMHKLKRIIEENKVIIKNKSSPFNFDASKKTKIERLEQIERIIKKIKTSINSLKLQLKEILELYDQSIPRKLNPDDLSSKNVVSIFDSNLVRTFNIPTNTLTEDIIIVKTFYFKVLEDIVLNGFIHNSKKYVCFTASAGQIRTKKTVFIRESLLNKYLLTLMCGLTIEHINNIGGININKFLAYLALCNSATDPWPEFDISKTIVVNDFETEIEVEVDFIDHNTFSIERKTMKIPINHTDGCGMILPQLSKKSMMIRLPWVKGLLVPFAFDEFIKKYCSGKAIIRDIYGVEHDILAEGIEVIFTKSQFKMHQFYDNWDDYKNNFMLHNCSASKCNEEPDRIGFAKINYQMLQTLIDMRKDEIDSITKRTKHNIEKISKDKNTMLRMLGVVKENTNKNYLQQALEIYPELLQDSYSMNIIKQVKQSLVKEARSGKLDINGKYTFICPDLFAFCEYLFLSRKNPTGLLKNGEVCCKLYSNKKKLDCLRSPHLYIEHAIRENKVDKTKIEWFITQGLYTSCHDPISKILMFDNDGDTSLVVSEKTIVEAAERNTQDVVPLYYEMKKAKPCLITNRAIYDGLTTAYSGGNIGVFSNNISKILNSNHIDLDIIKILTAQNNYVIDYAKTLYKPVIPRAIRKKISSYTNKKLPHFFKYAKDKTDKQIEKPNNSTMNCITKTIVNKRVVFKKPDFSEFDYTKLFSNNKYKPSLDTEIAKEIIKLYTKLDLNKKFIYTIESEDEKLNSRSEPYVYYDIRQQLLNLHDNKYYVVDILVEYLYSLKQSNYKQTLWSSFGDILVENLKKHVSKKNTYCEKCGILIPKTSNRTKYCEQCKQELERVRQRRKWHNNKIKYKKLPL